MKLSASPSALLASLYHPDDPVRSFLNCYVLCSVKFDALFNLLQDPDRDLRYCERSQSFSELLGNDTSAEQLQAELEAADDDVALLTAAAMLTALSRHVAVRHGSELTLYSEPYRSSVAFGNAPYWLAVQQQGLLHRRIARRPRSLKELHSTISRFHEPLVVVPAQMDQWKLLRVAASLSLESHFEQRANARGLRVAVSPLSYDAELHGESTRHEHRLPPDGFHLTAVNPADRQKTALTEVLQLAYDKGVAVLVLPELRIPPCLLALTQGFLRQQVLTADRGLLLVAAGSWHIEEDGSRLNRCSILDVNGDVLWTHDKLREFEVTPENVASAPELFGRIGVGPEGGFESITRGLTLEFYESVLGRLAVATCIGFFSPEVEPVLQGSRADVFLVPAMTPSMLDLEKRADALVRTQHAFTFAANCGRVGSSAFSFCRWPAAGASSRQLATGKRLLVLDLNDISIHNVD